MSRHVPRGLTHYIRDLAGLWRADPRPDGELLTAFVAGDGGAFTTLVVRHGQPVWATCRRVLGNDADAEDAFQAAFIALARKAAQVRPESLTGWLQKVSHEVALNARKAGQRRAAAHRRLFEQATPPADIPPTDEELRAAVEEELARLPERLRVPLTLYYLDGKTQAEVGRILGVTDRAAAHRLNRGLDLLRDRVARRGLVVTGAILAAVLGHVPTAGAMPAGLIEAAVEAARVAAAGGEPATTAVRLALEVAAATGRTRLKLFGLLALAALGTVAGGVLCLQPGRATAPPTRPTTPPAVADRTDRFGDPLPDGAVARIGTLRFRTGQAGSSSSVAFGPGEKVLISAHGNNAVHFWDVETGREVRKLDAPTMCWGVSSTADGRRLAGIGATEVWAWDLTGEAPQLLWKTKSNAAGFGTAEYSPDSRLIACGTDTAQTISLLDASTGTKVRTLAGRGNRFAFSADSKQLAAWRSDAPEVGIWDVTTDNRRHTLAAGGNKQGVSSAAFSPDGKTLATVGQDRHLRLWDVQEGKERRRPADDSDANAFVGFVPGGPTLVEVGGGRIRYWDPATGRPARPTTKTSEGWGFTNRLSADGTRLVSSYPNGVSLRELATGQELVVANGLPNGVMLAVAFTPDSETLATALFSETAGAALQLWSASDGRLRRRLDLGGQQLIWALDITPDGTVSAAVGALTELPFPPPNRIARWDSATGAGRPGLMLPAGSRCSACSPDGQILAAESRDRVVLCDRITGREVRVLPGRCEATYLAFSADGSTLAALDAKAGRATIWTLADGRAVQWPPAPKGTEKALTLRPPLALSPDGRLIAAGAEDKNGSIRVADVATGVEQLRLEGYPHGWPVQEFAFSPDGRTFAAGGADGVVRVWEVVTGQERHRLSGHRSNVVEVTYSPDGRRLASASLDSTALVWDVSAPSGPAPRERATPADLGAALAGWDAAAAHRAIVALAESPATAVPLLRSRLLAAQATPAQVRQWLTDLGADDFAVREAATAELARRGSEVEVELRKTLAETSSAEVRARANRLLTGIGTRSPANRLAVRGVEALERMGPDPGARQLLRELAAAPADSTLGREARAATRRLTREPAGPPGTPPRRD